LKKYATIFLLFVVSYFGQAQRSEVGVFAGASFYLGDLNSIPFRDSKFVGGLVYRYNFTPRFALKANILFGKIAASDEKNHSWLKDPTVRNASDYYSWSYTERRLSFSSPISEISAQLEINFLNLYNVGHKNQITPYIFGGASFFSFNPKAEYQGKIYDLQPIGTEGQGYKTDEQGKIIPKYGLTGFAIPFGIGFKANIGTFVCVGVEWGLRFTFTDYLDDVGGRYYEFSPDEISSNSYEIVKYFADPAVIKHTYDSQRRSTIKNDWYSFAGIIVTIRIGNEDRICDIKTNIKLKHKKNKKL
jgi:hypothetical protein